MTDLNNEILKKIKFSENKSAPRKTDLKGISLPEACEIKNRLIRKETQYNNIKKVSQSFLKNYITEPKINELPFNEKDCFTLGSILHIALLEPDFWLASERIYYDLLKPKDQTALKVLTQKALKIPGLVRFFNYAKYKEKVFTTKNLKCKIDLLTKEGQLVELKTTSRLKIKYGFHSRYNIKNHILSKAIMEFRYDLQMAFYRDILISNGEDVKECWIVFFETSWPYEIVFVKLSEETLEIGKNGNEYLWGYQDAYNDFITNNNREKFDLYNEI